MAKLFPSFIFSNPTNTKSKGPFLIHTKYPRFIAKPSPSLDITILEKWDDALDEEFELVLKRASAWLLAQLNSREIRPF